MQPGVIDLMRKRPAEILREAEPVHHPCQQAAQTAADQREQRHRQQGLLPASEPSMPMQDRRQNGNQDIDRAVIDRFRVKEHLEQVRGIADHNPRHNPSEHGDQDRPDGIQIQGKPEPLDRLGKNQVDQDPAKHQQEITPEFFPVHPAASQQFRTCPCHIVSPCLPDQVHTRRRYRLFSVFLKKAVCLIHNDLIVSYHRKRKQRRANRQKYQ